MDNKKELRDRLDEATVNGFTALSKLEPGTREYTETAEIVMKFYEMGVKETEKEREFMSKSDEALDKERDYETKKEQLENDRKSQKLRFVGDLLKASVPAVVYLMCFGFGMANEQRPDGGIIKSPTFKGHIGKLKL